MHRRPKVTLSAVVVEKSEIFTLEVNNGSVFSKEIEPM